MERDKAYSIVSWMKPNLSELHAIGIQDHEDNSDQRRRLNLTFPHELIVDLLEFLGACRKSFR